MNHAIRLAAWVAALAIGLSWGGLSAYAAAKPTAKAAASKASAKESEQPDAAKDASAKPPEKVAVPAARRTSVYRILAPGVLEPVYPTRPLDETVERHDVIELLAVDKNFDFAKEVPFRHDVWMLDFTFKPVRMMWVDVPGAGGRMDRKLVWYMVYMVKNPGKTLHPVEAADGKWNIELVDQPVRFIPSFILEAHDRLQDETAGFTKAYTDKLIPVAFAPIAIREDKNRKFYNTVDMAKDPIGVNEERWGLATWEGIDPHNVWFSVYVEGLTNAHRFKDDTTKYGGSGAYRSMFWKVLKLNFWRLGDEYTEKENQIRFGVEGKPSSEWVWRRAF
jgi:hypothetical protein